MVMQAEAMIGVIFFIIGASYDIKVIQNKPIKYIIISHIGVLGGVLLFVDALFVGFLAQILF